MVSQPIHSINILLLYQLTVAMRLQPAFHSTDIWIESFQTARYTATYSHRVRPAAIMVLETRSSTLI